MTTVYTAKDPELTWCGHPVVKGTLLRNKVTGDVGQLEWASTLSLTSKPRDWNDYYLKVLVWRAGRKRLWRGKDVEVVLPDDEGVRE